VLMALSQTNKGNKKNNGAMHPIIGLPVRTLGRKGLVPPFQHDL
jgi:hypothetical protein